MADADLEFVDVSARLVAAVAVGMGIGLNRDIADKPIGMRTLGLVALGAALVALSTVHFNVLADHPDALSRVVQGVIQGVMAGIGFIGAGVIMRDPSSGNVEGLTTAATVWVTAALGIACALASWAIVAVSVSLAVFLLVVVAWLEAAVERGRSR
ncbi:MgtC/SapB family protein [Methyloceanibacter caenitepidi]|nr:MgtC/SapB family protein [Methyloceanibacter caenitepidi]